MKKGGIRKQVSGGKIEEIFEIKVDKKGNKVVTGHRNFNDEDKKASVAKGR